MFVSLQALWDVNSGVEIDCLSVHAAEVLAMEICKNGQSIVIASRDRTANIWEWVSLKGG